jgi:hypothetical protein
MEARLHAVERALIDERMDRALDTWRAAWLQAAARARGWSVTDRTIAGVHAGRT